MGKESKYLVKGVVFTIILLIVTANLFYAYNYKKNKDIVAEKINISYDDVMNIPTVASGKILFNKQCSKCHSVKGNHEMFFDKIVDNKYDKKLLYAFIRNSDSVIKSGNAYYNALFNEYNKVRMTPFPELSDDEIDNILSYIKVEKTIKHLPKHK